MVPRIQVFLPFVECSRCKLARKHGCLYEFWVCYVIQSPKLAVLRKSDDNLVPRSQFILIIRWPRCIVLRLQLCFSSPKHCMLSRPHSSVKRTRFPQVLKRFFFQVVSINLITTILLLRGVFPSIAKSRLSISFCSTKPIPQRRVRPTFAVGLQSRKVPVSRLHGYESSKAWFIIET